MHAKRHPFFEGLVFGLAALLALIILVAGGRRFFSASRSSSSGPSVASSSSNSEAYGQNVPEGGNLERTVTERSVADSAPAAVSYGAGEKSSVAPAVPRP